MKNNDAMTNNEAMTNNDAMRDPSRHFSSPQAVVKEEGLSREQKIEILRQWEYDARQLDVAEEENMGGGEASQLDQVLAALQELSADRVAEEAHPTKPGREKA